MMTALCPAWARAYETLFLWFHPEQFRVQAFRLLEPIFFSSYPLAGSVRD